MRASLMLTLLLFAQDMFRQVYANEHHGRQFADDPLLNAVLNQQFAEKPAKEIIFIVGPGCGGWDSNFIQDSMITLQKRAKTYLIGDGEKSQSETELLKRIQELKPSTHTKYTVIVLAHGLNEAEHVHKIQISTEPGKRFTDTCGLLQVLKEKLSNVDFLLASCHSGTAAITCGESLGDGSTIVALAPAHTSLRASTGKIFFAAISWMPPDFDLSARNLLLCWALAMETTRYQFSETDRYAVISGNGRVISLKDVLLSFEAQPITPEEEDEIHKMLIGILSPREISNSIIDLGLAPFDFVKRGEEVYENMGPLWLIAVLLQRRIIKAEYYGPKSEYLDSLIQEINAKPSLRP